MNNAKTALVIGANGGIGSEACAALRRHGWQVRALVRTPKPDAPGDIEWLTGDAMNAADVLRAAEGADVIVHAVNPPGYHDWDTLVLPMLDNSIAAAKANRARLVLPGTIYNFGPDAFPVLHEKSPQHPITRKGEIRAEMERRITAASKVGVRSLILRCGDFFGPQPGNNWFSQGLIKQGKRIRTVSYPGPSELGHAWAYLPDVGEALARLLDRENELADVESFNFGGYWLDGDAMTATIRRVTHDPSIAQGRFPWWMTALAAPFMETLRELRKMRYLWQSPIRLDDSKLLAFLGDKPYMPIDDAMHQTLLGIGCLSDREHLLSARA